MAIQTIMIVKRILGYFSISFPESSMFAFIAIELISKLSIGFSNVRSLTTNFTSLLIGIHSKKAEPAIMRYGVARKTSTQRLIHTGNPFRKKLHIKGELIID